MIDVDTILSVFDSKGTLLKWLKNLDETIQNAELDYIDVNQSGNSFSFIFVYKNGNFVESPVVTLSGGGDSDIFVAVYNQTSLVDIGAALALNKLVLCFYNNRLYTYASTETIVSPPAVTVHFVSVEDKTVYMINVTDLGTWSTTSFELQSKLVSGTSIKTVNGTSLLGSGNISTKELPSITGHANKYLKVNSSGTGVEWGSVSGGGGTQLYLHTLSNSSETYYFISTSNTTISYDDVYQGYDVKGYLISVIYADDDVGARRNCLTFDAGMHSPSECYIDRVVFFNGTTWDTKTMSTSLTDTVTAL